MKQSDKKKFNTEKNQSSKNRKKSTYDLAKIFTAIKKFVNRIPLGLILQRTIKTIVICACSVVIIFSLFLLCRTRIPLSDVFTTGRISILKNRPENITRDIIIDLVSLGERGGISVLTKILIEDIAKKRPNWRFLILTSKNRKHMYDYLPRSDNVKRIEVNISPSPLIYVQRPFKSQLFGKIQDKLTQLLHFDAVFCDNNCDLIWDPIGDCSLCNFVIVPRISTIHDLACFNNDPRSFAAKDKALKAYLTTNAIHFSKKIITVSEFSQKQICDEFHVSKNFVKHVPIQLGTRVYSVVETKKSITVLNKYRLKPQKYFIFCSSWWKNKNHGNLMKAFNKFAQKNSDIKLILVGKHPGMFESRPITDYCSDRLIIAGFVPDEELGILLKNALAFIHPSVYEGFGMPIIEAMANGIPVACSNVASLPEIAGSAALLFDPFNVDSITQAMHRLADDPQLRKELIKKGYEQAKKYSDRDAMVDEYIRVMEEVMRENDLKKATMKK